VEWHDGDALWIRSDAGPVTGERLAYRSARGLLEYALARRLPEQIGLEPGTAPLVAVPNGSIWFHWLGDIYGRAVQELLRFTIEARPSPQPGLCVRLPEALRVLPSFLPVALRRRAVVEQFDVEAFLCAVSVLRPIITSEEAYEDLVALIEDTSTGRP
jgi:hypothetical protein